MAVPDGLPDDDAVADAVHTLLLRHEVLRTAFDADRDPVAHSLAGPDSFFLAVAFSGS